MTCPGAGRERRPAGESSSHGRVTANRSHPEQRRSYHLLQREGRDVLVGIRRLGICRKSQTQGSGSVRIPSAGPKGGSHDDAAPSEYPHECNRGRTGRISIDRTKMLSTSNVAIQFGAKPLFEQVTVKFCRRQSLWPDRRERLRQDPRS